MKNIQRKDILKMSKDYNKKGIKKVESYKKKMKENIFRKVIEDLEPYQKKTKQSAFTKAIQVTSDKQIKKRKRIRRLKIDENQ